MSFSADREVYYCVYFMKLSTFYFKYIFIVVLFLPWRRQQRNKLKSFLSVLFFTAHFREKELRSKPYTRIPEIQSRTSE